MENTKRLRIGILAMMLLTLGYYSSTTQYANAVSINTVTFPAGAATFDVAYRSGLGSSNTDTTAYIIGTHGGVVKVWKKNSPADTIGNNVTLTGSASVRAIEFNPDIIAVYAVTNDKFWKLTTAPAISISLASGVANTVDDLIYDDSTNTMYYCHSDGYGTLNQVTLTPTNRYSDPQTNSVLSCALDETNQMMYLVGDDIGASLTCEAIKVRLTDHTQQNCVNTDPADTILEDVCYDSTHNEIWASSSANSRVINYNSLLTQITFVTTAATPRLCTIINDNGANRVYFNIQSNDNIVIIDTEADVSLSTHLVCPDITGSTKLDAKRLVNTTNVYATCAGASNSVLIDDTVSEDIPPEEPEGSTNGRCNTGTVLDCIGDRSTSTAITGGQDITVVSGNLLCGLGFNATCSGNADENGTGIILMLLLGTFLSSAIFATIAVANTKFGAGISYTEIPKELWLFLVVGVVAFAWYQQWIPDILFYGMIVGIAGLFSFGLYKHIRGG